MPSHDDGRFLPTCSWSIDSFGHSAGTSGLFASLGYSQQVLNRIPYTLKSHFSSGGVASQFTRFMQKSQAHLVGEGEGEAKGKTFWNREDTTTSASSLRNNIFQYQSSRENTRFHFTHTPATTHTSSGSGSGSSSGSGKVHMETSRLATTVLPGHYSLPCPAFSPCAYLFEMPLSTVDAKAVAKKLLIHALSQAVHVVLVPSSRTSKPNTNTNTKRERETDLSGRETKDGNKQEYSEIGHFLLLLGDDFSARKADVMYHNIDLVIEQFNLLQQSTTNTDTDGLSYSFSAQYSTPRRYFEAYASIDRSSEIDVVNITAPTFHLRHSQHTDAPSSTETSLAPTLSSTASTESSHAVKLSARLTLSGKGDFLPYSDNMVNDWTGFYGSRPALKHQIR